MGAWGDVDIDLGGREETRREETRREETRREETRRDKKRKEEKKKEKERKGKKRRSEQRMDEPIEQIQTKDEEKSCRGRIAILSNNPRRRKKKKKKKMKDLEAAGERTEKLHTDAKTDKLGHRAMGDCRSEHNFDIAFAGGE